MASEADIKPRGVNTTNTGGATTNNNSGSTGSSTVDALNYGLNTGGSTAALHLEDLGRIADAVTVANITKNAGQTAGLHVNDLLNMKDRADAFNKEIVNANIKKMGATPYAHLDELTNTPAQKAASAAAFSAEVKAANAKKAADAAAKKKAADDIKKFGGNAIAASQFANWKAMGGLIQRFAMGGFARGTDTVPAMLTPGEFIMSKYAVDSYGLDTMRKINNGELSSGSVYNNTYTLTVNAKTDANPDEIAQAVMATIKRVDDRRIRGVAIGGRR